MISIEQVSFGYSGNKGTVKNANLKISQGECILLCGESGCGKTTITKLINGLIPHFTDNCKLEGKVITAGMTVAKTQLYELAKKVGSVFQNPKSQFFNIDADSEIVFGLENEGVPPELIQERFDDTVRELGIERLLGRNIFTMSGGEKQTLAFASVYAMNPKIYVLDEPSANLDGEAIERLRRQIAKIKSQGHTVVIAEHRLYFLTELIDRAIYLKDGEIVKAFTGEEFIKLSEQERIKLGLRSIAKNPMNIPIATLSENSQGLHVKNLSCKIKKEWVFQNVSFSATYGQIIGIVGHNGAGKTTLSRCLTGLLKESMGEISLDGKSLSKKQRTKLSFLVMQDVNHQLFSDSVWNECEMADVNCSSEKIESVLQAFDLLDFRDSHPMAMSGGQKQRLAVATAVLTDKKILIFDEPTSGLDRKHMIEVSNVIKKLAKSGHIVLIVTHDMEFLSNTCDKVVAMSNDQ